MVGNELMRIGVSIPENLLTTFDNVMEKRGYSSRSEGIRDAIRMYIDHYEWMGGIEGQRIGIITMVYDHAQRGLTNEVNEIQHHAVSVVHSSLHIHLDEYNCLEIVVLQGEAEVVRKIAEKLKALKGVKHLKLTTVVHERED
ncbi:MAG: nickel-responsive transcriptional regulator NikR [Methermicoccaceae archaeon]